MEAITTFLNENINVKKEIQVDHHDHDELQQFQEEKLKSQNVQVTPQISTSPEEVFTISKDEEETKNEQEDKEVTFTEAHQSSEQSDITQLDMMMVCSFRDSSKEASVQDAVTTHESNSVDTEIQPENNLSHTPRDSGFTSENFKIEITGLPKRLGFKELKKRLTTTLGLRPHKLKAVPMKPFAFVCFTSEEERSRALEAINGHVWKGQQLKAKKAQPIKDPLKRKQEDDAGEMDKTKKQRLETSSLSPMERLRAAVAPLWGMPYEEQLELKAGLAKSVLSSVANCGQVRLQFTKARKDYERMCCQLMPPTPSPVMEGYRNKAEFSIGPSEAGDEKVVGFRFGLYKAGTVCVGDPSEVPIISNDAKSVAKCFQDYVRNSGYTVFDHKTHIGHWKQLTVRTTQGGGGTMAIAEFVVNNLTHEQLDAEKAAIKNCFTQGAGRDSGVTTFFFRPCTSSTTNSNTEEPYELIFGDGYIFETMLGMKFRISPSAFFQVNTAAAEQLYLLIGDWCHVSPNTTVLDICCGTGTIGLSIAKSVKQVIGIEMCEEAVADAKVNAATNGVENCFYHCAKVQDVIHDVIRGLGNSDDVVAILDPPRAGVDPVVIKHLRLCTKIKRIVYAACQPQNAKTNFIDLVRPSTKKTKGAPFKFITAKPVDLFPHTKHYELLILFERDQSAVAYINDDMDSD